ncbi:Beta-lactamase domain protein [Thermobacillus xylanilyticus]|jgi:phosphoribosyl 1,2-cyclic phosphate phosphodiesterase|uniref:Metal-dependent hydrolase, beta-lactamase superfamily I n=2 Tax=Thermobacillus TaxID=76632 RepID=L0EC88_THECK|nr:MULTISPECIES: MBL fold metallo-hydrolase [Thermobacillus]AGA57858.1 metal-dependent hydrolase, beta-lactamase superfamily I [Thermobacillus composti KWC4]REJ21551.1 MAG: MBL fold metallo-hydrolase [Paenibacillaceae bacterium]CAG5079278.1 Beta-lactamase domain protein [Thermobacillus xylanilyticus]
MTATLRFLGTGDAMGVPRVYCDCAVCTEARATGVNRRFRSAVLIDDPEAGHIMIDCGPDWGRMMETAGLRFAERMLLTHGHYDHIGGLPEWADACRWQERRGVAYAPEVTIAEVTARFPWLSRTIEFRPADGGFRLGGWNVRAWRVNHGHNGYAHAYRFDHAETGWSWAYCPDAIGLSEAEKAPLAGLDLLVLGTSFWHETIPYERRSVHDVVEALELLRELKPRAAVFTHLSHDIDLTRRYELPESVRFAETGLRIRLGDG